MGIGWMIFIVATLGWHIGLYGMFKKAGIDAWKAFIPFYNTWCMVQKMGLRKHWFFFQLVPIAGQFITIWIAIKFVEHFGRFSFLQHGATVLFPFLYFPYLGFSKNEKYAGTLVVKNYKKTVLREWIDAAAFAVVAATLIRTFVFEAYVIPTPSMEKTLLVNDYLFVSKFAYGPRLPNTPLALPFIHNSIGQSGMKSYVEWIHLPYIRWFASPVKRNDIVVFNFPVNDTLINNDKFGSQTTYYQAVRDAGRDAVWRDYGDIIITRPVDKRENFIKRCVGIPGDSIQVVNGKLVVNGQPQQVFPQSQRYYKLQTPPDVFVDKDLLAGMGIAIREDQGDLQQIGTALYKVNITNEERPSVKLPPGYTLTDYLIDYHDPLFRSEELYPYYDSSRHWSVDNYGPVWVPKKGATIPLTADNVARYERCIRVYEGNSLEARGGKYFVNGTEAASYTFRMDYYWLMGDNRHNSLDSRYWGYVPEDHVVGKASLIWFSWEGGPRWKRIFRWIN
jgi:signal peptidase I